MPSRSSRSAEVTGARWGEVAAVVGTGALHLLCKPLGLQGFYIVGAIVCWTVLVLVTAHRRPAVLREWGFTRDNLGATSLAVAGIFAPVVVLMVVWAWFRGSLAAPPTLPLMLLLYPAWGLVQQFLVQALLIGNLARGPLQGREPWLIGAGGCLFSLVHAGNPFLMLATAGVGAAFVWLYLRYRNLWPLGLAHGWLASLFYLWFLDRDPLIEIFAPLLGAAGLPP